MMKINMYWNIPSLNRVLSDLVNLLQIRIDYAGPNILNYKNSTPSVHLLWYYLLAKGAFPA